MPDPRPAPDTIARLEALADELARLEPGLERWLGSTDAAPDRERAQRVALQLRLQVARIEAVLSAPGLPSAPVPWHGQERRGPRRATNVARLPERPAAGRPDTAASPNPQDWEPF